MSKFKEVKKYSRSPDKRGGQVFFKVKNGYGFLSIPHYILNRYIGNSSRLGLFYNSEKGLLLIKPAERGYKAVNRINKTTVSFRFKDSKEYIIDSAPYWSYKDALVVDILNL